ncbi:MAG: hypothetical protein GY809_23450 [Planctomycetes bacterium]|nr:hypothetical protein [Planctomycetota bacterium]
MDLSKRETMILYGALATIVLLIGWTFVFQPMSKRMAETHQHKLSLEEEVNAVKNLLDRRKTIQARWQTCLDNGLGSDPAATESAMWHRLTQWSSDSNFDLPNITPQRMANESAFQEVIFTVSGKGTLEGAARLIWAIEQSQMPVRISSLQLGSPDPSGRDITLSMRLSVLYLDESKSEAS